MKPGKDTQAVWLFVEVGLVLFEGQLGFVIRFLNLLVERVGELQPNLNQFA